MKFVDNFTTRLLLDTHILIWWLGDSPSLPQSVVNKVRTENTEVFISQVSFWEITIKVRIGKLKFPVPIYELEQEVINRGFHWLQIQNSHFLELAKLEKNKNHKDPFDRLLVAQSRGECIDLITVDKKLEFYGIEIFR